MQRLFNGFSSIITAVSARLPDRETITRIPASLLARISSPFQRNQCLLASELDRIDATPLRAEDQAFQKSSNSSVTSEQTNLSLQLQADAGHRVATTTLPPLTPSSRASTPPVVSSLHNPAASNNPMLNSTDALCADLTKAMNESFSSSSEPLDLSEIDRNPLEQSLYIPTPFEHAATNLLAEQESASPSAAQETSSTRILLPKKKSVPVQPQKPSSLWASQEEPAPSMHASTESLHTVRCELEESTEAPTTPTTPPANSTLPSSTFTFPSMYNNQPPTS